MNCQKTSSESCSCAAVESAELPAVRSGYYVLLARGFSHPDQSVVEFFHQAGQEYTDEKGSMSQALGALLKAACDTAANELERLHMQVFDPIAGPFPYETEHRKGHEFAQAHIMADVMGFYRAFGVEPNADRPDHIAAELEFMHLLTLKESHALTRGQPDKAELCRKAQQDFLREHLLTWDRTLLKVIRAKPGTDSLVFYPHLLRVFQLFMENERENLA